MQVVSGDKVPVSGNIFSNKTQGRKLKMNYKQEELYLLPVVALNGDDLLSNKTHGRKLKMKHKQEEHCQCRTASSTWRQCASYK